MLKPWSDLRFCGAASGDGGVWPEVDAVGGGKTIFFKVKKAKPASLRFSLPLTIWRESGERKRGRASERNLNCRRIKESAKEKLVLTPCSVDLE